MMKGSDIPLTAIRAFVMIGRHGNFTRAATALGITQSAVSRHVATLEALADGSLFERRGATVAFTPTGLQFYEAVKDAVSTIEMAAQQIAQRGRSHGRLQVRNSMPSFAMTVVAPLLGSYMARHPAQIDLITSLYPPQLQDEFDVLITRDLTLPDTDSWELVREELVCVGSPGLVAANRDKSPQHWKMISARSRPDIMAIWAVARGIPTEQLEVVGTYDHLFLAVAGALGGTGLLVVPRMLVIDHLRDGTLTLGDDLKVSSGAVYMAFVNASSEHADLARDFCRWLKGCLRDRLSLD